MATTDLSAYDKNTIPNAKALRFGIVVSEWNSDITENLLKGAIETLEENGAEDQKHFSTMGSGQLRIDFWL